jgi:hypothetical protein
VNRFQLFLVCLILFISPGLARADEFVRPTAIQSSADSDWDFKQLTIEFLRARSPGNRKFNLQAIERYYWNSNEFAGNGLPLQNSNLIGWEKYRDELSKDMSGFLQLTLLPNSADFKVLRRDATVSTRISFREVGKLLDGRRIDQTSNIQLEWRKVDDHWVIGRERILAPNEANIVTSL